MLKWLANFIFGTTPKTTQECAVLSVDSKREVKIFKPITLERYLTSDEKYPYRIKSSELTGDVKANAIKLLFYVNKLLQDLNINDVEINSGWRTIADNEKAGGSKKSNHLRGLAIDIADKDGKIDELCKNNIDLLEKHGIYIESPDKTVGWSHMQVVEPKSGNRIFNP